MVSVEELESTKVNQVTRPIAIDESVSVSSDDRIDEELERLLLWASNALGSDQLIKAKEEFYWQSGKIFPDDSFYASRMAYFIDNFLLDRPIDRHKTFEGLTPFEAYEDENTKTIQPLRHSVFSVQRKNQSKLQLKCLISGEKFVVMARPDQRLDGIEKKDIFQCYIYRLNEANYLSKGTIFHPYKAYKIIQRSLKKALSSPDFEATKALFQLARQQLRHCRHPHIDPRKFYQDDRI